MWWVPHRGQLKHVWINNLRDPCSYCFNFQSRIPTPWLWIARWQFFPNCLTNTDIILGPFWCWLRRGESRSMNDVPHCFSCIYTIQYVIIRHHLTSIEIEDYLSCCHLLTGSFWMDGIRMTHPFLWGDISSVFWIAPGKVKPRVAPSLTPGWDGSPLDTKAEWGGQLWNSAQSRGSLTGWAKSDEPVCHSGAPGLHR